MKKPYKVSLIVIAVVVAIYIVCSVTKAAIFLKASSSANFPSLKNGERFIASCLAKAKRFDLICFNTDTKEFGKIMRAYRLCGMPGDIIQIKNGVLYVNGKNADDGLNLASRYKVKMSDSTKLKPYMPVDDYSPFDLREDSIEIDLADKEVVAKKLPAIHIVFPATDIQEGMSTQLQNNYNPDNAGPFKVPAGSYFVMGDNRRSAEDSRYLGFIPGKDIVATVIGRW